MSDDRIYAPWTAAQVDALNSFQRCGYRHEFTCPGHDAGDRTLVATRRGWICPHCDYTQEWARAGMLELPPNPTDGFGAVPLITEEWLKSVGFKWHQFDRQPGKHWLLWLGGGLKQRPSLTDYEDIGIELTANVPPRDGEPPEWFCWFRSDCAGRYHRFIHVRHLTTTKDVIDLVQAISGRPWAPRNHLYGSLRSPESAERLRKDLERLDQRLMREGHKWAEVDNDDSRGRALPEHMRVAENARVKKP
jgi:hypothetical protein